MPGLRSYFSWKRGAIMSEAQEAKDRAVREKCNGGKIPAKDAEQIEFTVRQIIDAVFVQIQFNTSVPKIPDPVHTPARLGDVRSACFDRMQVSQKLIFGEGIVIRVRAECAGRCSFASTRFADEAIAVALIEGQADRVSLISFCSSRLRSDD